LTAIARRPSTGGRIGLINAVDRYDPGRGSFAAFMV
jgi:DNA-directed RNA polymerase specialized sigma subunit